MPAATRPEARHDARPERRLPRAEPVRPRRPRPEPEATQPAGSAFGRIVLAVAVVVAVRLFFFAVRVALSH